MEFWLVLCWWYSIHLEMKGATGCSDSTQGSLNFEFLSTKSFHRVVRRALGVPGVAEKQDLDQQSPSCARGLFDACGRLKWILLLEGGKQREALQCSASISTSRWCLLLLSLGQSRYSLNAMSLVTRTPSLRGSHFTAIGHSIDRSMY